MDDALQLQEQLRKTVNFGIDGAKKAMATSPDYANSPADLIADIMHWCESQGMDFERELAKARFYCDADRGLAESVDFPIP